MIKPKPKRLPVTLLGKTDPTGKNDVSLIRSPSIIPSQNAGAHTGAVLYGANGSAGNPVLPYGDTDTGENGNGDPTGLPSDLSGYSKLDLFALRAGLGYPWSPSKTTNMPTANSTLQNPSGAVPSPILKPSELDDIKNILKQFSDVKGEKEIQWNGKFFDDPQDYDMIEYGYRLYMEDQGK